MLKKLKLLRHKHSGKLRKHKHTSYIPLLVILLIVGLALFATTAYAKTPYDGPESSSVSLTGVVEGKPPTEAAVIQSPTDNQHFSSTPITISGTCPDNTLVEIFKNDIFAGSTVCTTDKKFSLDIDLMYGQNLLVAKVYDALNQVGPDSNKIIIFYDVLPLQSAPLTSIGLEGSQLVLNTDAAVRGVFPDQELSIPIDIIGGTAPYAVNIMWGDSNNSVISRNDNNTFNATHTYSKAGTYQISIQASDANGRVAFITLAAIVNGQPSVASASTTSTSTTNKLLILWPLYLCTIVAVISFFVGEKREKQVLNKRGLLVQIR